MLNGSIDRTEGYRKGIKGPVKQTHLIERLILQKGQLISFNEPLMR